jgi:hypothetical protein
MNCASASGRIIARADPAALVVVAPVTSAALPGSFALVPLSFPAAPTTLA